MTPAPREHTPFGTLVFISASARVYSLFEPAVADAVLAVGDLGYRLSRRWRSPQSLFMFRKLDELEISTDLLTRYPRAFREEAQRLLA